MTVLAEALNLVLTVESCESDADSRFFELYQIQNDDLMKGVALQIGEMYLAYGCRVEAQRMFNYGISAQSQLIRDQALSGLLRAIR